jgi:hypothetical protein
MKLKFLKSRRAGLGLFLLGLGSVAVLALLLVISMGGNQEASAKAQPKTDNKDLVKTLKVVSVDTPATFKGVAPYPTRPQQGQQLLAVTVDFDRSFIDHLRASESGEVYLTGSTAKDTYYTVDTSIPQSDGPGKKPKTQATFVFSVPQGAGPLTFHYDQYSVAIPQKGK